MAQLVVRFLPEDVQERLKLIERSVIMTSPIA